MNKLILLILFSLSYCNAVIGQDSHIHFIEKPDSQKISIYIECNHAFFHNSKLLYEKSIIKVYFSLQMLLLFFVFPESYFMS